MLKDGGPAFPERHGPEFYVSGMTLRQWYAGKALQTITITGSVGEVQAVVDANMRAVANMCLQMADALIEAGKPQPDEECSLIPSDNNGA